MFEGAVGGTRRPWSAWAVLALVLVVGCKKNPPEGAGSAQTPTPSERPAPNTERSDAGVVAGPLGPRAEVSGEHCALTATLAGPPAVPGDGTIDVQLEAKDGFHINELDEVQLQLEGTSATVRGELARTDATESTQDRIKFVVPVQVASAGAAIRGRLRFSVCASVCIRQRLAFQVGLP